MRSRLLDFMEPDPPGRTVPEQGPRRSTLLDLVEAAPPPSPAMDDRPRPRPGVPAYHTPPFVVFELFEHPAHGTVAFAFTTPEKLVEALGAAQPWVAASIGPLAEGVSEQGVTVLLDPRAAPGQHNWQPADLTAYALEVRR